MHTCRLCSQQCDSNKRLANRTFREMAQDIFCTLIDVSPTNHATVCDVCHRKVATYYSFKHRCRQREQDRKFDRKRPASIGFAVLRNIETSADTGIERCIGGAPKDPRTADENQDSDDDGIVPLEFDDNNKRRKRPPPKRVLLRFTKEQLGNRTKKELYNERRTKICELCGKSLPDIQMESHMNGHLGLKPYFCEEPDCDMAFRCARDRRTHHRRNHSNEKFTCDTCGKVLGSKMSLRSHLYTHRDKEFECEICGLMLINKSRLELHMRVHTQKRDFKCPHCPKTFYVNTVLTLHLRSHSGEKPYVCHICHVANSHRVLYVKHMKKFHPGEEIYKLCDMPKILNKVKSS